MFVQREVFTLLVTAGLALAALPAAAAELPAAGKAIGDGGGSVKVEGGKYTIEGEGADIWDRDQDHLFFVSTEVTGDGSITARLNSASGGAEDALEKAGVMIREDLDPNSRHVTLHETDFGYGLTLLRRTSKGGTSAQEYGFAPRRFPIWLRLQRVDNEFAGFFSWDGQLWIPTTSRAATMGEKAHFGLAVSSHEDGRLMTTEWDNVSVGADVQVVGLQACGNAGGVVLTWKPLKGAQSYNVFRGAPAIDRNSVKLDQVVQINTAAVTEATFTDNSEALQPGARQIYAVAPVMADGKQGPLTMVFAARTGPPLSPLPGYTVSVFGNHREGTCPQGSVGAAVDPATGIITLRSGGNDFWEANNNHAVVLTQKVSGNARITVQIMDFPLAVSTCCTKGGVILLEELAGNARNVMATLRTDGVRTQWRPRKGAASAEGPFLLDRDEARAALKTGLYFRVERIGDDVTTYYSLDGTNFEEMDVTTLEGLANDVELGLALTARDRDSPVRNLLSEMPFKIISIDKL